MKNEVQNIISGKSKVKYGTFIQTILNYLTRSEGTSAMDKNHKHFKVEETERLRKFIDNENLWINTINVDNYLSEGAEQKVYFVFYRYRFLYHQFINCNKRIQF
mgnify:CR=1 FL=1